MSPTLEADFYQLSRQGSPHNHMVGSQFFFSSPVDEYVSLTIAVAVLLWKQCMAPSH